MSKNTYLILSIVAILGSTVFNYASLGDMSKYQRSSSSPSSRSFGSSHSGGGYSSGGWHK